MGGSGMTSGLRTRTLKLESSLSRAMGKGYKSVEEVTVPIKKNRFIRSFKIYF